MDRRFGFLPFCSAVPGEKGKKGKAAVNRRTPKRRTHFPFLGSYLDADSAARCVMRKVETSIAEGLRRAHVALRNDLGKLEKATQSRPTEGPGEMRARLSTTRTHLAEHFRFEEQNGYMDAVRVNQPRLEHTIQQLAEEHRQLMQSLDALIEEAAAARSLGEPFHAAVRSWIERVQAHEERENDLVQDAFNQDIGAED